MALWDEVDERVLRWVASLPSPFFEQGTIDFNTREAPPFASIEGLNERQVVESLNRLRGHGFIDGQDAGFMGGGETWHDLRARPLGLIYLGEWPDLDLVASAASLHKVLRLAAEDAPDEERTALLRAAGVVGRTVDGVIRDTLSDVAHGAGGEAAE